ncbi:MAG: MATE family efflux transporter [bacterium]|nr:MATE family efflux transporter [bacterium]
MLRALMRTFKLPTHADIAAMLRLAVPVVIAQIGMMAMGVVDTMVVGRVSATALAAVALGNLLVMAISSFGFGTLMALDPLVAQGIGADDSVAVRRAVQRGLVIAMALCVPSALVLSTAEPMLRLLRQPQEVIPLAAGYVHICIPGLMPFLCFVVLRQTLQAMERMRPIIVAMVVANVFNLVADITLVHGLWGVPALGPIGSAWATTASRTILFLTLIAVSRRELAPVLKSLDREALRLAPLWRTFRLGFPIGVQLQLEFVAFGVIALLMGGLGTLEMAAHQVTINLASLTFMVPLGVSAATAVRVGHAVGRADDDGVRRAAGAGLACGGGFMATTACLFLGVPQLLAAAYTTMPDVRILAASLIPIAGVFQIVDGLQVTSAGVLRGLGDTRAPMLINVLGFWLVGIPVSLWLGFGIGLGPPGLWWGLVAGLAAVAVLLLARVATKLSRPVTRVEVE